MGDERNLYHLKKVSPEKAAALTGPRSRDRRTNTTDVLGFQVGPNRFVGPTDATEKMRKVRESRSSQKFRGF